jgi:hypothetical protein
MTQQGLFSAASLAAGLFGVELSQMLKPEPLGMRLPLPRSREKHKMREPLFPKAAPLDQCDDHEERA